MELISVIVPVYNVEKYLDRCIESIVNQTYKNLEIILVDDGSPDKCPQMCDDWAKKDSRIRVIHKKNGGGAEARNCALDVATGDYVSFVDSDDVIHNDFYNIMLTTLTENDCDIVECNYIKDDKLPLHATSSIICKLNTTEAMKQHLCGDYCSSLIWNKLYKRKVIDEIRFVPGKMIDDEFFTYKAIGNSKKTIVIDSVLYYYRQQEYSVMHRAYSLKRLVAIDAKIEKYNYIQNKFPELQIIAKRQIAGGCIYHGQMALKNLSGIDKQNAMIYLKDNYNKYKMLPNDIKELKLKHKLWFYLANKSFLLCCKLRNLFNIGF